MTRAIVTVGLGFGDEGKGSVVDFLVRHHKADLVVRYSGGCQAGHNVVLPDGRHHMFSQFGAGTFTGARTWLDKNVIIDPFALLAEARHLEQLGIANPLSLWSCNPDCLVTTHYHRAANRKREEIRGSARHGSCGMGIGETRDYAIKYPDAAIRAKDLLRGRRSELLDKLVTMCNRLRMPGIPDEAVMYAPAQAQEYYEISKFLTLFEQPSKSDFIVFEGAQGILLDELVGFHPYTTWSDVTLNAAKNALEACGVKEYTTMGITRTFHTRHGPGPFPSEVKGLTLANDHNKKHDWQGDFRVGLLDERLLSYANDNAREHIDEIAVTWMDVPPTEYIRGNIPLPPYWFYPTERTPQQQEKLGAALSQTEFRKYPVKSYTDLLDVIETATAPVKLLSVGPTWQHKARL